MRRPPFFGVEFLAWLRETSERAWRAGPQDGWQAGTRWTGGLAPAALASIESRIGRRLAA